MRRHISAGVVVVALAVLGAEVFARDIAGATNTTDAKVFAVGSRSEVFVDTTRPMPAHGDVPLSPQRSLETVILYPAQGTPTDTPVPGAPPAHAARRFPLLIRAHGLGGSPAVAVPLLEHWAAAGYVVALPRFPLSNQDASGGPTSDYLAQTGDMSFVITKMIELAHHDPTLRGVIDTQAIGVTGFSDGGATVLGVTFNTCCTDRRIRAASATGAGAVPLGGDYYTGKPVPLLLIRGTADPNYQRTVETFNEAKSPVHLVALEGAPHQVYVEPWRSVAINAEIDFFDRYLKHQRTKLGKLEHDTTIPQIATFATHRAGAPGQR